MKFGTKVIHSGLKTDVATGAIITPIYQTSTYVQKKPGENLGYEYSRTANPTRTALEQSIASIENGKFAICYSSGMGAADAIIKLLKPGNTIVSNKDIYGGTYRMFEQVFTNFGLKFKYTDLKNPKNLLDEINSETKLIWLETPSNPLLEIINIKAIKKLIDKRKDIIIVVDNTFASPALQNPLNLGADIVLHSATKYLGGHSDLVMGALITNNKTLYNKLFLITKSCGAVPGPMDCFLALRGIKTLDVRMQKHCKNAHKINQFLSNCSKIGNIYWPGRRNHPNHLVAKKQMKDFGGMMSFTLKNNSFNNAVKIIKNTKLFKLAESLGGVESLISHPASMTHASIPKKEREKNNLSESLIRISIGIEDHEDLIKDLSQAINKIN
ncbi:MAG: cystathionine gamma-synthase [Flavobacteriales bacterium]|nr:cystathionine gamma-synthase [Flavobacteriales bacterium]|tara:strand:- start:13193 stop:14344 length:1152 start_codon:yes stop_codon:yes gene_type:complete